MAAFLQQGTALYAFPVLLSKLGTAFALCLVYLFTAELYPTSVRNTAVGTCNAIGPLGGLVAPWVGKYLPNQGFYPQYVTLYVFGGLAVLSGLCAFQLPETLGHHLPNSFDDVEKIKEETKQIWTWRWGRWARDDQETQILLR